MGKSRKELQNNQKPSSPLAKNEAKLGVDQDEQAMNGLYGMLETQEEDQANKKSRE